MEVFKSKIDWWLLVILVFAIAVSLISAYATVKQAGTSNTIIGVLLALVGAGLPLWLLLTTKYIVASQLLTISSGPFSWVVPLSSISSVTETRNPLSSPALSLDRLAIKYENGKTVMVSPADKAAFRTAIGHPEN